MNTEPEDDAPLALCIVLAGLFPPLRWRLNPDAADLGVVTCEYGPIKIHVYPASPEQTAEGLPWGAHGFVDGGQRRLSWLGVPVYAKTLDTLVPQVLGEAVRYLLQDAAKNPARIPEIPAWGIVAVRHATHKLLSEVEPVHKSRPAYARRGKEPWIVVERATIRRGNALLAKLDKQQARIDRNRVDAEVKAQRVREMTG